MHPDEVIKRFKAEINAHNKASEACGYSWCCRLEGHEGMHWRPWDRAPQPLDVTASDDLLAKLVAVKTLTDGWPRARAY